VHMLVAMGMGSGASDQEEAGSQKLRKRSHCPGLNWLSWLSVRSGLGEFK
jgi:hypothetical protein